MDRWCACPQNANLVIFFGVFGEQLDSKPSYSYFEHLEIFDLRGGVRSRNRSFRGGRRTPPDQLDGFFAVLCSCGDNPGFTGTENGPPRTLLEANSLCMSGTLLARRHTSFGASCILALASFNCLALASSLSSSGNSVPAEPPGNRTPQPPPPPARRKVVGDSLNA